MRIIFTNVNFPGNVGDFWSSPLKYYKFPFKYEHIHLLDIHRGITNVGGYDRFKIKDSIIIIGGGGLLTYKNNYVQNVIDYLTKNNQVILWSIGSNTTTDIVDYSIVGHDNVKLAGIRDIVYGEKFDYLPCVSCKHTLFDNDVEVTDDVGVYEHIDLPINIDNLPKLKNSAKIDDVFNFIKSKNTIITSTFHGVYWSQLLNKKVIYYTNTGLNSKFVNLKHRIDTCDENNYLEKIQDVSYVEGMLLESRKINDDFYQKVLKFIKNL
jgi:hypothetical protein